MYRIAGWVVSSSQSRGAFSFMFDTGCSNRVARGTSFVTYHRLEFWRKTGSKGCQARQTRRPFRFSTELIASTCELAIESEGPSPRGPVTGYRTEPIQGTRKFKSREFHCPWASRARGSWSRCRSLHRNGPTQGVSTWWCGWCGCLWQGAVIRNECGTAQESASGRAGHEAHRTWRGCRRTCTPHRIENASQRSR